MKSNINFFVRAYWIKVSIAFLTCMLFLSLPSCEKKKTLEEILIGTWVMVSQHYIGYEDGVKTVDYTNDFDPYECTILLQKDGTGKEYRFEKSGHYFSEDPFFWRITDGDSDSCECILSFYINDTDTCECILGFHINDEFIGEGLFCCTVNENYLTLHISYGDKCPDGDGSPDPDGDGSPLPSDGPNPPWGPNLGKGGGSYSSEDWCESSVWLSLKRQ